MRETETSKQHPEGLTAIQENLANLLITTKIRDVPIKRRRQLSDGGYEFYEIRRDTTPFDLAQEGEFVFKLHENNPAAPLAPDKIVLRNLPKNVLDQIGKVLADVQLERCPDLCAGIADAGIPLAKAYSKYSGVPFENLFTKVQTEKGRRIVAIEKADGEEIKLLLVDDALTKGFSFFEAAMALENTRYEIIGLLTVVDREEGGRMRLINRGYNFAAAFRHSQLLNYYLRIRKINKTKYDGIMAYIAFNKNQQ